MANIIFKAWDLPTFDSVSGTSLVAKRGDGELGYVLSSQLQTQLDTSGLATDAELTAVSASLASAFPTTGNVTVLSASVTIHSASIAALSSSYLTNSSSVSTKLENTAFAYITGSIGAAWNDASASAAGVLVGHLYHSQGAVKVRLS